MPEELGTKDVLAQLNLRLGNVEQDIRDLRGEMNARFTHIDHRFNWIYGLLVAVLLSNAGLWFK